MAAHAGYLRRLGRRLTEDLDRLDAEEMAETADASGACRASECCRGDEVTMLGRLRSVEMAPRCAGASLEAEFFDGTDTVTLVWMGQRRIPGIEPGKRVMVRGRVGERAGEKVIYNPYYELREAL
ncbi:OB-fold nucleic acid binding domain-containing protein [Smaragdicoccus niigatensis]|uniref:OB-fold nucleic acid binding domain-containing protein n=1 Tax=Smaragdicoccus niigatensis TaxID=359359 RepID=UPI000477DBAC|nr:OB-fold nucleic acid binding domain-containing protein [Smaragdicoccus niigatensis]MCE5290400.1 OB-fold nucleic acid binding domain-containing protein [Nocardiaceae bacterium]